MDTNRIIFSIYDVSLSLVFGLLTIYIALKVIDKLVLKVNTLKMVKEGNISIALFKAILIICTLLLIQTSIKSSNSALQTMAEAHNKITIKIFMISLGYFFLFYVISLTFSVLLILISFFVYIKATIDLDEIAEIKKNNIAVSISLSLIIFGMTLFIRPAFHNLIGSFVNYNALQVEQVDTKNKGGGVVPKRIAPPR
ncbi:DUF350 domain-containing protein [Microscilla marina]|uniref:DUF350 domain-containing protein n=1 Tax=Microscilla marina ATCC 23134 TaxID=313606 RepID=A1ZJL9_MICM2|nr:DUF350 domain-containing protein [Microscilla marina]EAY29322.1 hypothetical protein M23134_01378 [Microscilla marina ATCC 23134]